MKVETQENATSTDQIMETVEVSVITIIAMLYDIDIDLSL